MTRGRVVWPGLLALVVAACAPYTAKTRELLPQLSAGRFDAALRTLDDNRASRDELLYLLQKGLVLHQAGRWDESNRTFEAAERRADDLYTKSVSQAVASWIINDTTVAYRAEPFEMAMVPYYRALNYIRLEQPGEALVEARKASHDLERWVDLTGRALGDDESWKQTRARLNNNAFLQYFSGLLYEWNGEINDAFIAYRNAADAYALATQVLAVRAPADLGAGLVRTGRLLGFDDELRHLRERHPGLLPDDGGGPPAAGGEGQVVLLLELGVVPGKVQREIDFPILESDDYDDYDAWAVDLSGRVAVGWHSPGNVKIDYWLRVAFPQLVSTRPGIDSARVEAIGAGRSTPAVPVEDLEGRAFNTFEAGQPKLVVKTVARALIKYAAKKEAEKKNEVAGYLVNLFGAVLEKADTRSWSTLPNSIWIARLSLPPGTHDLHLQLGAAPGRPALTESIPGVVVRAQDTTFVAYRVY